MQKAHLPCVPFVRWVGGARLGEFWLLNKTKMPPKVSELIARLEQAGFQNRGGKGSHRNFVHPNVTKPITISGNLSADAKRYQERLVQQAIRESKS